MHASEPAPALSIHRGVVKKRIELSGQSATISFRKSPSETMPPVKGPTGVRLSSTVPQFTPFFRPHGINETYKAGKIGKHPAPTRGPLPCDIGRIASLLTNSPGKMRIDLPPGEATRERYSGVSCPQHAGRAAPPASATRASSA